VEGGLRSPGVSSWQELKMSTIFTQAVSYDRWKANWSWFWILDRPAEATDGAYNAQGLYAV
jgi:hypothetical protein